MIAIIDYGAGNVASVANALTKLGEQFVITANKEEIEKSDKIIFPGVGEASFAMNQIQKTGLVQTLQTTQKPLFGICLGMQLLCDFSEEGDTKCLGVFPLPVRKFDVTKTKVPHIGWNTAHIKTDNPLFRDIPQDQFFYFANSFYVPESEFTIASTGNTIQFSAALAYKNFYGTQFHPEKSSETGVKLLHNFILYC